MSLLTVTARQVIESALRDLGALASGESATPEELTDGMLALNIMIKSWMGPSNALCPGIKMWQRTRGSLTLSVKASYSFKTSAGYDLNVDPPVSIISATLRTAAGVDIAVLAPMTLAEYQVISNKAQTGSPQKFYYERGKTEGTLYFDCVPSDTTCTVELVYLRILTHLTTEDGSDTVDFPEEWFRALRYNLAVDLYPEYPLCTQERLAAIATIAKTALAQVNFFEPEENSPIYFEPGRDD